MMLFGPPGTGKTTFARAIASRLGWPFVELFPSRLAGSASGLAGGLSEAFAAVARMEHVLVFIDDAQARSTLWHRATDGQATLDVDVDVLVAASAGLTPADIGHATQLVAQYTFEASLDSGARVRPSTDVYLDALTQTRPTLDDADIAAFTKDIERFQRS